MSDGAVKQTKVRRGSWIIWWRIDPDELETQISQYGTLPDWRSMRGISVLCLALSIAITIALTVFGAEGFDASAFIDVGLMAVLAVFIYLGHRWAMIAAMVLWSLEKLLMVASSPALAIGQLVWWVIYMHAFYFAFRVEQGRRTSRVTDVDVFN